MEPQQLDHGLYGRRDAQQRDPCGFARQVLVHAEQSADAGTVEKFHAAQIDGDGFDARLPELLALCLEVASSVRIKPGRFHDQMQRLIFQFSFNDSRHPTQHAPIDRARELKYGT